jgi:hypothetical protein
MNSYEVYRAYLALRLHFTTDYDFFKYKGAVKSSESSFNKLNIRERSAMDSIAAMKEPRSYLIGNMMLGKESFIGSFTPDPYLKYRKFLTNGTYIFKEEVTHLKVPYGLNFKVDQGSIPYIMYLYSNEVVSLYTICVLQKAFKWLDQIDNPLLAQQVNRINKSVGFFKYDEAVAKKTLIDNAKLR